MAAKKGALRQALLKAGERLVTFVPFTRRHMEDAFSPGSFDEADVACEHRCGMVGANGDERAFLSAKALYGAQQLSLERSVVDWLDEVVEGVDGIPLHGIRHRACHEHDYGMRVLGANRPGDFHAVGPRCVYLDVEQIQIDIRRRGIGEKGSAGGKCPDARADPMLAQHLFGPGIKQGELFPVVFQKRDGHHIVAPVVANVRSVGKDSRRRRVRPLTKLAWIRANQAGNRCMGLTGD